LDLSDVIVIIPALNEERALPLVLRDLPPVGRVVVVDNGSTDATSEVAHHHGAFVVREPRRGYGSACLRGLDVITERIAVGEPPPHVVVFVDADHSDHAEYLPQLVAPISDGTADFVLGSRMLGEREPGALPIPALLGNRLACYLMRRLFGTIYTDLGPFRAIRYDRLCELQMRDTNYGWTIEMQIKAARAGLRTLEIAVPYRRRVGRSKISGTITGVIRAGSKILWTIARQWFRNPPSARTTQRR
jgi:hypothetical protein